MAFKNRILEYKGVGYFMKNILKSAFLCIAEERGLI
jgi:hypothetical protein